MFISLAKNFIFTKNKIQVYEKSREKYVIFLSIIIQIFLSNQKVESF